eukprot:Gb_30441 [translate_table: standard]
MCLYLLCTIKPTALQTGVASVITCTTQDGPTSSMASHDSSD